MYRYRDPLSYTFHHTIYCRLIAEVILYSEGFESSKTLAQKMAQMYQLCSEQLSQQDHYDFGTSVLWCQSVKQCRISAPIYVTNTP